MQVTRLELPNGDWVERHLDPSRGQLKEIERLTRAAFDTNAPSMNTEDALVVTLVSAWSLTLDDGTPAPVTREALDKISGARTQPILEDLAAIYDRARGTNAIQRLDATWRMIAETLSLDDRAKFSELHDKVFGLIDPNPSAGKV